MSSFEVKLTLLNLFAFSIIDVTYLSLASSPDNFNKYAGQKLYGTSKNLLNQTKYSATPFPSKRQEYHYTKCDMK